MQKSARKTLAIASLAAAILLLAGSLALPTKQAPASLASADKAAVTLPQSYEIIDHYGDPDNFIKYLIRKPPARV